jgi:malate dehydrogenase
MCMCMCACSMLVDGEYGLSGVYMGVPVVLGAGGAEGIVEVALSADEQNKLEVNAAECRALLESVLGYQQLSA